MNNFLNFLGLYILPSVLNLYIKTLRIKIHNLPDENSNNIFIFWHGQMLAGWWIFKNKRVAALVSQSKDGNILNNILNKWNYKVIRGSSSRGGKDALKEIIELANQNYSVVITPDGPRGPANEIKNGAFIISSECKIPVIPVKIVYKRKTVITKSWDKFIIPLPFSICEVYFGNRYLYNKYLDEDELNKLKKRISEEM